MTIRIIRTVVHNADADTSIKGECVPGVRFMAKPFDFSFVIGLFITYLLLLYSFPVYSDRRLIFFFNKSLFFNTFFILGI